MNDAQRKKAAALLQETNKFFDARFGAVDLDDETRRKLAAVGMDNALEDWTYLGTTEGAPAGRCRMVGVGKGPPGRPVRGDKARSSAKQASVKQRVSTPYRPTTATARLPLARHLINLVPRWVRAAYARASVIDIKPSTVTHSTT